MKLDIFAVKDVKTNAFLKPFFVQNEAVMQRAMTDAKNDENSTISMHPEDYQVFKLGTYDDNTGVIEADAPTFKLNVSELE